MRRLIALGSKGERLIGTLDLPVGLARAGVLIVSGGREVRAGAHRGMAMLAAELADAGLAVFRFDRAGVGDSTGKDRGWAASGPDIFNAWLILHNETGLDAIIGVGNCDAAAALAVFGRDTGVGSVVLTNPWLGDEPDALPPPSVIRARYWERLVSPSAWKRLFTGRVNLRRLAAGLGKITRPGPANDLAARVLDGITDWGEDATVVLAKRDATAIAFGAAAGSRGFRTYQLDSASHSFAGEANRAELKRIVIAEAGRLLLLFEEDELGRGKGDEMGASPSSREGPSRE